MALRLEETVKVVSTPTESAPCEMPSPVTPAQESPEPQPALPPTPLQDPDQLGNPLS